MKRLLDIVLSVIGMLFLSPVILIIVLAIKIDSKGPVLFRQKRVGIGKSHFYMLKFRTMRTDTPGETPTHLLENPERYITRVGRFLRKTSLDELPQIWNILVAHMSLVGPRPALWNQYDLIEERDRYGANDVRPGLTGWAQVNGRDELAIDIKAKLDGDYIQKMNFIFDVKCILLTAAKVLRRDGIVEGKIHTEESRGIKINQPVHTAQIAGSVNADETNKFEVVPEVVEMGKSKS